MITRKATLLASAATLAAFFVSGVSQAAVLPTKPQGGLDPTTVIVLPSGSITLSTLATQAAAGGSSGAAVTAEAQTARTNEAADLAAANLAQAQVATAASNLVTESSTARIKEAAALSAAQAAQTSATAAAANAATVQTNLQAEASTARANETAALTAGQNAATTAATAQATAASASSTASTAQTTASSAQSSATSAQSAASGAASSAAAAQATASAALPISKVGVANGAAALGATGLVPVAQLPFGTGAGQIPDAAADAASIATKAPLSSPAFSGAPTVPTITLGQTGTQIVNANALTAALANNTSSNGSLTPAQQSQLSGAVQSAGGDATNTTVIATGASVSRTQAAISADELNAATLAAAALPKTGDGSGVLVTATGASGSRSLAAISLDEMTAATLAAAAVPTSKVGTASGVAPLDASKLVPTANLPFGTTTGKVADAGTLATVQATANAAIPSSASGAASGVAPLGTNTKVPLTYLPTGTTTGTLADAGTLATVQATANAALPAAKLGAASGAASLDASSNLSALAQSAFGTVPRAMAAHFAGAQGLDVRDYGAKCDGTTDDTVAIQNAINVATGVTPTTPSGWSAYQAATYGWAVGVGPNANGGGKVLLGSGSCKISAPLVANLTTNSAFALIGDGTSHTQIFTTATGDLLDVKFAANSAGNDLRHVGSLLGQALQIQGIQFQTAYVGTNTGRAINITGIRGSYANDMPDNVIQDVAINNHDGFPSGTEGFKYGVYAQDVSFLHIARLHVVDRSANLAQGIEYASTATASDTTGSSGKAAALNLTVDDFFQDGGQSAIDISGYGVQAVFIKRPQWITIQNGITWIPAVNSSSGSLSITDASGSSGASDVHVANIATLFSTGNFYYSNWTAAQNPNINWHGFWADNDSSVQESNDQIYAPTITPTSASYAAYGDVIYGMTNTSGSTAYNNPSVISNTTVAGSDYGFSAEGYNVTLTGISCRGATVCQQDTYTGTDTLRHPTIANSNAGTGTVLADSGSVPVEHAAASQLFDHGLTSSGAVTAPSVAATGAVTAATVAASGSVSAPAITATGAVSGATVAATTSVTAPTVTGSTSVVTPKLSAGAGGVVSTGTVTAPTVAATTSVTAPTVAATTAVTAPTITASTSVSAPTVTASTSITAPTMTAGTGGVASSGLVTAPGVTSTGNVNGVNLGASGAAFSAQFLPYVSGTPVIVGDSSGASIGGPIVSNSRASFAGITSSQSIVDQSVTFKSLVTYPSQSAIDGSDGDVMTCATAGSTVASGAAVLPPNPLNAQTFTLSAECTVTALTVSAAKNTAGVTPTLQGAPSTLSYGSSAEWIYDASNAVWTPWGGGGSSGTTTTTGGGGTTTTTSTIVAPTYITASRALTSSDCGLRLDTTGASAITLTVPSGFTSCRISFTQLGSGVLTIAAASGETIGYYDTSSEASGTGSVSPAGQYAGIVMTSETTTTATVGGGE